MISLREAREQKNLTVEQLADLANLNPETVAAVEDGAQHPSLTVALKLSKALETPITEIQELAVVMTGVLGGGVDPLLGPRVGPR